MALKVSGFNSVAIDYKIVSYDNTNSPSSAIQENVTGSSGTLYSVDMDNKSGSVAIIRLQDYASPVLGNSTSGLADMFWAVPATTAKRVEIPGGIAFSQLNLWTTANGPVLETANPASGGLIITIVCS